MSSPFKELDEKYNEAESGKPVQLAYSCDPWKILVCSVLLNRSTRTQLNKVRHDLFRRYPTAQKMASASSAEIAEILRPLGFQNKKAMTLLVLSLDVIHNGLPRTREEALKLPGCGDYSADSYALFVLKDYTIAPMDKVLSNYVSTFRQYSRLLSD